MRRREAGRKGKRKLGREGRWKMQILIKRRNRETWSGKTQRKTISRCNR